MRDQVAALPEGLTVGQPVVEFVLLVPGVTGVAIAGPPLVMGSQQMVAVRWASPSIWNTPEVVELSTPLWAFVDIAVNPSVEKASAPKHDVIRLNLGHRVILIAVSLLCLKLSIF
jgi:hypothetical protein